MPKSLIDEDLPRSTARVLRQAGYQAEDVRDVGLRGASDEKVFEYAQAQSAVLVTGDSDFANVLRFPPSKHSGIIVSRIPDELAADTLNEILLAALRSLQEDELHAVLVVVEPGRIRMRR